MGYIFRGMIASRELLTMYSNQYENMKVIDLYKDLSIVPLTDELYDEINNYNGSSIANYDYFTDHMLELCKMISRQGRIAYIEAEYFGGAGYQSGMVIDKEMILLEETRADDIINKVLKMFNIEKEPGLDEFDTVRLGRYRYVCDWI